MALSDTTVEVVQESPQSAVAWAAVIAGAIAAAALSFLLAVLGAALGFSIISPWSSAGAAAATFATGAAIWLIVMQWLSAALGGFVTGRLRNRWSISDDEVFFRDTVHGFLAWALATLIVLAVAGSTMFAIAGAGAQVVSSVAGGAAQGAATGGAIAAADASDPTAYLVDLLFRPNVETPDSAAAPAAEPAPSASTGSAATEPPTPAPATSAPLPQAPSPATAVASPDPDASTAIRGEVGRILITGLVGDEFPAEDRAYLSTLVANQTNLSDEEATARVDDVLARAAEAKAAVATAADEARKASATASFFLFFSLLIGAFIGAVAGALGGRMHDDISVIPARR